MRKIILICLLFGFIDEIQAQGQQQNLAKYWSYRQRLRDRFMVVSKNAEAKGTNIPAASIDLTNGVINWDDNNGAFNQYLSMLATEYYLLNKNGEDTSETLKELLWAMWSLERLDYGSEAMWRSGAIIPGDINGMHIRDDVSNGFWAANSSHFPVPNFGSVYVGDSEHPPYEEISQDNMIHMFEAMSLINKLVTGLQQFSSYDTPIYNGPTQIYYYLTGKYIVYPWQNATIYVDFAGWAKDIVRRYVHWAQHSSLTYSFALGQVTNYWVIRNPVTGALVREGNGDDMSLGVCYNVGFIRTASRMSNDTGIREQDPFLISVQKANETFDKIFNLGTSADVDVIWPSFANMAHISATDLFDDYKIRSMSTSGNGPNGFDFNQLRILRDANNVLDYEHFPLIWSALYDDNNVTFPVDSWMYQEDQGHLEPLMDRAPATGPKTNGEHDWSSDSRLTWPEKLGERASQNIELSGIDYMLLHNLYYIAFRREDYSYLSITSGYSNGTWSGGRVEASNTLASGTNSTYIGRKSVRLLPGFTASSGSSFYAKIQGKPNNYNGGLYVKPSSGGGRIAAGYDALENQDMVSNFLGSGVPDESILHQTIYMSPNLGKDDLFRVYPNPAGSDLNVAVYKAFEDGEVKILDIQGRELIGQKLQPGIGVVDLRGLPNGIYIVKVRIGVEEVTSKMTVLK